MRNNNLASHRLGILIIFSGINLPLQANSSDWMLVERFTSVQQQTHNSKVQAMYDLVRLYERGRGTAVNFSQAAEWYQKASAVGNNAAKARLGILYIEYRSVSQADKDATLPVILHAD